MIPEQSLLTGCVFVLLTLFQFPWHQFNRGNNSISIQFIDLTLYKSSKIYIVALIQELGDSFNGTHNQYSFEIDLITL